MKQGMGADCNDGVYYKEAVQQDFSEKTTFEGHLHELSMGQEHSYKSRRRNIETRML